MVQPQPWWGGGGGGPTTLRLKCTPGRRSLRSSGSRTSLPLLLPARFCRISTCCRQAVGHFGHVCFCLLANMLHMSRPITKLSNCEGTCYYIKSAWVQGEGEERGHISLKNIMGMWSKGRFLIYTMSLLHLLCFSREQVGGGGLERTNIFFDIKSYLNLHWS